MASRKIVRGVITYWNPLLNHGKAVTEEYGIVLIKLNYARHFQLGRLNPEWPDEQAPCELQFIGRYPFEGDEILLEAEDEDREDERVVKVASIWGFRDEYAALSLLTT